MASTSTVTVQVTPASNARNPLTLNPLVTSETTFVPALAVRVCPFPVGQSVEAFAGEAITIPVGRLSVKDKLIILEVFAELSIVKVSVLHFPRSTVAGEKDFEKPG
jgi:hypothetical protein